MRRTTLALAGLALAALSVAACADDRLAGHTVTGPASPPATGAVAYLEISSAGARRGDTVTVTAFVRRAPGMRALGSFTARLAYDTTSLAFAGEAPLAGGLRAVHAALGAVAAAGASPAGFEDDRLFAVRFRVESPAALAALELSLSEVRGVDFADQRPALAVRRAVSFARAR